MEEITPQLQNLNTPELLPPHKHFLNKKFIITFVILILLGAGAYAGIWYWGEFNSRYGFENTIITPTPRMADWKTYTNTQYGFEVKYPESYSISNTPNGSSITFRSTEACKSLVSEGGEWPIDCQSYNILVQQNKISGPEMSKTFVAGIQAERYSDSNGMWSNGTQILVQFQKSQNWYIQTFTFNTGKSQISESIMDQILSTFKFTDSADTSTWKTYTNTEYGIELKYPSTWKIQEKLAGPGFWINPPDFKMPSSGTVNPYFSFGITAHMYLGDEKPVIKMFGTRTGYVYVKDQSVYFPEANVAGGYFIKLYTPTGVDEPNQILSTFKFTESNSGGQTVCTQEAKQCPDGSYVSRTGLNCAFAACP